MADLAQYEDNPFVGGKCNDHWTKQVFNLALTVVAKAIPVAGIAGKTTCDGTGKDLVIYRDNRTSLQREKRLLYVAGFFLFTWLLSKILK